MIEQGTDGISRGNLMEGVMTGKSMLSFVPIHLTAMERSKGLLRWIRQWTNNSGLAPLTTTGWLWKGQGLKSELWTNCDGMQFPILGSETMFLWSPPPAIAEVALEYLRVAVHRRPQLYHIFVCPKLMTFKWRKILLKSCDLSFYIDASSEHWPGAMHESLLVGMYLPLLHCYPWSYRNTRSVLEVERALRSVQNSKTRTQGSILFKFLKLTRRIPTFQDGLVRRMLSKGQIR